MKQRRSAWLPAWAVLWCLALCLGPARAAAEGLAEAGWWQARWGMTEAELRAAFPGRLTALPGPREFGGAYAGLAMLDAAIGDVAFAAYFQMNAETARLQQVLLERRRPQATPADFERAVGALVEALGSPQDTCLEGGAGGLPARFALVWHTPATTVHAVFLDFSTTAVLERDPAEDIDPLVGFLEERLINRNFVPRRILVRAHAAGRADLAPACENAG